MKTLFILLLMTFASAVVTAQENQLYIEGDFRGMQCRGDRGICTFEPSEPETANAVLYKNKDNTLTLEIFRAQLGPEEEVHIFGEKITAGNQLV